MPLQPYIAPQHTLTDAQEIEATRETLQNLLVVRRDLLATPKPTYNIDGQEFKWNEYLDVINKSIKQLREDLRSAQGPFEEETVSYT